MPILVGRLHETKQPHRVKRPSCGRQKNGGARAAVFFHPARIRLHGLGHPRDGDVLAVVRCDGGEPPLVLGEGRLLREGLRGRAVGAATEPRSRSLAFGARKAVEGHRVGHVLRLASRPLSDCGGLRRVAGPRLRIGAVIRIALATAFTGAVMNSGFSLANVRVTIRPSKVQAPCLQMSPDVVNTLPIFFTLDSTGSQMNVASISPRPQAAAISGGRTLSACTSDAFSPAFCSAYRS